MSAVSLDTLPLFQVLKGKERILLAGAGGGYDVFSGLPLYFHLRKSGHKVYLANYTFSDILGLGDERDALVEVTSSSPGPAYFPEKYLCHWLDAYDRPGSTLYTFKPCGVVPLRAAYQALVERLQIDAIVLVDGGTDSLMRGDEHGLGTPIEDLTSIAAVQGLELSTKLLSCIGFGVDTFHGVCHHYFLEAVAALTESGHFLGTFSLLPEHEETQQTIKAADYVYSRMPNQMSIVLSSILNSAQGKFGDVHASQRTRGSELYLNPLMSIYWSFHLQGVAERCLYLDKLEKTQTAGEVHQAIHRFRENNQKDHRPWRDLPV
ncbi:MAG: DUF1152 domain-containing protein [Vulcanimicrobiota bacterium]